MPLAVITPTRLRWHWLLEQAKALAPQLGEDDLWIIATDNDLPSPKQHGQIEELIGEPRLMWCHLAYPRPDPPVCCVNRCHNAATAMAPAGYDLVEVDDHDILAQYALSEIRHAFEAGYDYVFGWYHQQALIEAPEWYRRKHPDEVTIEQWPDVRHKYSSGAFSRREIEAIGVRAFRRWVWDKIGGWDNDSWPCADYLFATRAEIAGANIVCLEQYLSTVTIEPDSLSATYRGAASQPAGGFQL